MAFEKFREEWTDMDPKFRIVIAAMVIVGGLFIAYRAIKAPAKPSALQSSKSMPMVDANGREINPMSTRVLPETLRNQGLEQLSGDVQSLRSEMDKLRSSIGLLPKPEAAMVAAKAAYAARAGSAPGATASPNLDAPLPDPTAPISFEAPGAGKTTNSAGESTGAVPDAPAALPPARMQTWPAEQLSTTDKAGASSLGAPTIPVNSALEAVLLSGFNARPSGATAGAVGSVISANKVGAPFVTRIKGDAILPNGWKLGDLGDCFLGGNAIAVLSTERANAIADTLSCIGKDGEEWEAHIEAFGLDVDGTLGIAGKVVSKQGSLLMQSALTGMVSGLGAALSPTAIPAYNSNATNGSTSGVQYPSPSALAATSLGQGINHAAAQLSKFYLDYAKEVFPVVEVTSGTRVTWILTKSVELKRRDATQVSLR